MVDAKDLATSFQELARQFYRLFLHFGSGTGTTLHVIHGTMWISLGGKVLWRRNENGAGKIQVTTNLGTALVEF